MIAHRIACLTGLLSVLISTHTAANGRASDSDPPADTLAWGEEHEGLQAAVGKRTGATSTESADNSTALVVKLRNVSKIPITFRHRSRHSGRSCATTMTRPSRSSCLLFSAVQSN